MSGHVFVDETKAKGFVMVAARVPSCDVTQARRKMTSLLRPSQRRIHFTDERDTSRKRILAMVSSLNAEITIYDASALRGNLWPRDACLAAIIEDAAARKDQLLVLERDDSLVASDRRVIFQSTHKFGCDGTLRYEHRRAYEESLLWIPDAIAWCWAYGGRWRQRVEHLVGETRRL
jgi:hypothetical protein